MLSLLTCVNPITVQLRGKCLILSSHFSLSAPISSSVIGGGALQDCLVGIIACRIVLMCLIWIKYSGERVGGK